ncbi:SPOR domain-containing protein [Cyclobacterium sp. 1_MG-2023]|uniref:SPOR domain-containing protein n=1 Tax=Cyclobacterium sp. 1_MG-2023 TaxID=3062681 RepID=UPI0026E285E9|nr:SPOR domain-containing protein [Cyclobacterium sp. 1_MG-2023]MDO6437681.1 SPOR domain-containing protein [Cyclobacterium sp. 1_MG-2023]
MTFTKTLLIVIIATVFFNCSSKTVGGLTKEEYKSWKQQKKEMSPEAFKALVEGKTKLSQENFNLLEKISYIEQQISRKENEIDRLARQVISLSTEQNQESNENRNSQEDEWSKGLVFKVQLAAFDELDLRELTENGSDMKIIDEDGYIKYILGQFRDYDMADLFKKKLRKIGVKEAWIVPYKDGNRVPLKEVITEVIE